MKNIITYKDKDVFLELIVKELSEKMVDKGYTGPKDEVCCIVIPEVPGKRIYFCGNDVLLKTAINDNGFYIIE